MVVSNCYAIFQVVVSDPDSAKYEKMENPYVTSTAPIDEVKTEETNPARLLVLDGRIGRWQFLGYGGLLGFVVLLVVAVPFLFLPAVVKNQETLRVLNIAGNLIALAPILLMARRRLQDMDHSGWWVLSLLVPGINLLAMLYLVFGPGMPGENRYGAPPPKNPTWVYPVSLLMMATLRGLFGFV